MFGIGLNLKPRLGGIPAPPVDDAMFTAYKAATTSAGYTIPEPYATRLNNFYTALRASGEHLNILTLSLEFMFDSDITEANRKTLSKIDFIDTTKVSTLNNDYVGSHLPGKGWEGSSNAKAFSILMAVNPSTLTGYAQNGVGLSCLFLEGATNVSNYASDSHAFASFGAGFGFANLLIRTKPQLSQVIINESDLITYSEQKLKGFVPSWWNGTRTGANLSTDYVWNAKTDVKTTASGAPVNCGILRFGAYANNAITAGFYDPRQQAAHFIHKSACNVFLVQQLINTYLAAPLASKAYFNKCILMKGDSIFSSASLGVYGEMIRKSVADVNNNWTAENLCIPNDLATTIDSNFATQSAPYYSSYWTKQPYSISASTNDIATGTKTGAQLDTIIESIKTKALATGFSKVIICGVVDRDAGFTGVSQAQFDIERAALRTLMLARYTNATGITNIWTDNAGTYYIDAINNANFANASDTTYFMVDKIHLNQTGNQAYSTAFFNPLMAIL
jgi:hypothetical protein